MSHQIKNTKIDRLDFVESRDGIKGMIRFAEQTLAVYVNDSIKRGPHGDSIRELTEELEAHGKRVQLVVVDDAENSY